MYTSWSNRSYTLYQTIHLTKNQSQPQLLQTVNWKLCPPHREGQDRKDRGNRGFIERGWWQMVGGDAASHCFQLHRNAVQSSEVQCREVQYSAVHCSAVQCSAVPSSAVQYSVVPSSAVTLDLCSASLTG